MCQSLPDFPNLIEDLDPYAIGNPAYELQNRESFCFVGSGGYSASKINYFYYVFLLLSLDGSHVLEQKLAPNYYPNLGLEAPKGNHNLSTIKIGKLDNISYVSNSVYTLQKDSISSKNSTHETLAKIQDQHTRD